MCLMVNHYQQVHAAYPGNKFGIGLCRSLDLGLCMTHTSAFNVPPWHSNDWSVWNILPQPMLGSARKFTILERKADACMNDQMKWSLVTSDRLEHVQRRRKRATTDAETDQKQTYVLSCGIGQESRVTLEECEELQEETRGKKHQHIPDNSKQLSDGHLLTIT